MANRSWLVLPCFMLALGISFAQNSSSRTNEQPPEITGEWTGTWGAYNPAQGTGQVKELCKRLDCKVEYTDRAWLATFEGDCGRPYKYTIKMEGRQAGKVVLFRGTADLGENDGGVFDWIGRANEQEFVGFFTSAQYTGTFNLSRSK